MPTKKAEDMKFYIATEDGNFEPLGYVDEADLSCEKVVLPLWTISDGEIVAYFTFDPLRSMFCNNYRRLHGKKPLRRKWMKRG